MKSSHQPCPYHEIWIYWNWQRVRIVVVMDIVWSALGALVILWGLLFEGLPPLEWLNVILLAAFAVAFIFFYVRCPATETG